MNLMKQSHRLDIAHIVNPVSVSKDSDLYIAQPITFETMRRAHDFAEDKINVSLFSTQYQEDHAIIPNYFTKTTDLDRSILDISNDVGGKKLPLIKDILDRLYESTDADYLVYTNVDIGLKENFYVEIAKIVESGYDAFSITRRTVSNEYKYISDIPSIYHDQGKPHPGLDCFVFHRRLYSLFKLGKVCLGLPPVGLVLLCNCMTYSKEFKLFKNKALTFHIGDDGFWRNRHENRAHLLNLTNGLGALENIYDSIEDTHRKNLLKHYMKKLKKKTHQNSFTKREHFFLRRLLRIGCLIRYKLGITGL